jgi:hypothetical protein
MPEKDEGTGAPSNIEKEKIDAPEIPTKGDKSVPRADGSEEVQELDEFGLPLKRRPRRPPEDSEDEFLEAHENSYEAKSDDKVASSPPQLQKKENLETQAPVSEQTISTIEKTNGEKIEKPNNLEKGAEPESGTLNKLHHDGIPKEEPIILHDIADQPRKRESTSYTPGHKSKPSQASRKSIISDRTSQDAGQISEWSHQQIIGQPIKEKEVQEDEWQEMPSYAPYDIYNDDGKLVAREVEDSDDEKAMYAGLGGAGKGYTRVQIDEDAQSATSMDDNTAYLFKSKGTDLLDDEDARDPLMQMQATKDLLTEGQRIAYVGIVKLSTVEMANAIDKIEHTRKTKKILDTAFEAMKMWGQKMMVRLYAHMDIESAGKY